MSHRRLVDSPAAGVAAAPRPAAAPALAPVGNGEDPAAGAGAPTLFSRRDFATRATWAGLGALVAAPLVGTVRLLVPRVSDEPPSRVRAGRPADYRVGAVDDRLLRSHGLFVVRDDRHLYALVARCTHLGCTPRFAPAEGKFKCPCHGSGFLLSGVNVEGPAPRPLERLHVELDEAGELVIDTARRYRAERGEWSLPGARLELRGG